MRCSAPGRPSTIYPRKVSTSKSDIDYMDDQDSVSQVTCTLENLGKL